MCPAAPSLAECSQSSLGLLPFDPWGLPVASAGLPVCRARTASFTSPARSAVPRVCWAVRTNVLGKETPSHSFPPRPSAVWFGRMPRDDGPAPRSLAAPCLPPWQGPAAVPHLLYGHAPHTFHVLIWSWPFQRHLPSHSYTLCFRRLSPQFLQWPFFLPWQTYPSGRSSEITS